MRVTFGKIFTLFLALATLFLTVKSFLGNILDIDIPVILLTVFMVVLCTYLVIYNSILVYKYFRLSKYPEALESLTMAFSQIHFCNKELLSYDFSELDDDKIELVESKVITNLIHSCNRLTEVFSLITGYKCSVSIKMIVEDSTNNNNNSVFTLARDNRSSGRNAPDTSQQDHIKHSLLTNTDFNSIIVQEQKGISDFFIHNYLPFHKNYLNTSFEVYGHPKEINKVFPMNLIQYIVRWKNWPLPYKSTIVVPIKPRKFEISGTRALGFICVDSKKMGVFKTYYDKQLLYGFGDGIYNLIEKFLEIRN